MDELGACLSTHVLLMFDAMCLIILLYYLCCVVIMDEVMEFVLIK